MIKTTKINRKRPFIKICTFLLAFAMFFQTGMALASDTLIDIFFLPHRPALKVVSEVEKVIAEFSNIETKKYSFEDPAAKELLKKYKLNGHMPVAIFINGQNTFLIKGKKISLNNFPKGNAFVPMFAGEWDYEDLQGILQRIDGDK